MSFSFAEFSASPVGMFLVLMLSAFFLGFIVRAVARRTLLPAVYRFLVEQQQLQQEELERQARLDFYLDDVRRRAVTAAATAEHAERVQADLAWLRDMEDARRRHEEAIQAQEPAVAERRAEEFGLRLRRDLEIKLGQLEANDYQLEDALAVAQHFSNGQHYRPAKDGLLYDSDDEDPEVIRGDRKGKRDN